MLARGEHSLDHGAQRRVDAQYPTVPYLPPAASSVQPAILPPRNCPGALHSTPKPTTVDTRRRRKRPGREVSGERAGLVTAERTGCEALCAKNLRATRCKERRDPCVREVSCDR